MFKWGFSMSSPGFVSYIVNRFQGADDHNALTVPSLNPGRPNYDCTDKNTRLNLEYKH